MQKFLCALFVLFLCSINGAYAANCVVKDADIAGSYSGDCKNGLANGQGKASGRDVYEGGFRDGMKEGKGIYISPNLATRSKMLL